VWDESSGAGEATLDPKMPRRPASGSAACAWRSPARPTSWLAVLKN